MRKKSYCLAQDPFGYCVYGETDDVLIFLRPNRDIKWELYFYLEKEELLQAVTRNNKTRSTIIIDVL